MPTCAVAEQGVWLCAICRPLAAGTINTHRRGRAAAIAARTLRMYGLDGLPHAKQEAGTRSIAGSAASCSRLPNSMAGLLVVLTCFAAQQQPQSSGGLAACCLLFMYKLPLDIFQTSVAGSMSSHT